VFCDRNRREKLDIISSYCRCSKCDAIFLNPTLDESGFDDYDLVYPSTSQLERRNLGKHFFMIYNYTLNGWLHNLPSGDGHGERILDVGCSNGRKLLDFRRRGYQVFGVDMASDAICEANKLFGEGFHCGSLDSARYDDDYFDYVRMDNTLEHIQDPFAVLHEVKRILKPGGSLFLYVPNGASISVRLLRGFSINSWIPFHVVLYSPATLKATLGHAGFKKARILTHAPPHLLISTLSQVIGKDSGCLTDFGRFTYLLWAFALPASYILNFLPFGEEIVAVAVK